MRLLLTFTLACSTNGFRTALPLSNIHGLVAPVLVHHYYSHSNNGAFRRPRSLVLARQSNSNSNSECERTLFESQRDEALQTLERITDLEEQVVRTRDNDDDNDNDYGVLSDQVKAVEQQVACLTSELLPPDGLSLQDYRSAVQIYADLPFVAREALCKSLGYESRDSGASQEALLKAPEIVSKMYEQRFQLTPQLLQDSLKESQGRREKATASILKSSSLGRATAKSTNVNNIDLLDDEDTVDEIMQELFDGKDPEEIVQGNAIKQTLPRQVTGRENHEKLGADATAGDADVLMGVLQADSSMFIPNGKPEPIPGGFLVRGKNKKENGGELIDAIDAKLPASFSAQVSYLQDFTLEGTLNENNGVGNDPVLAITTGDLAPATSGWILSVSSAAALISTFLFGIGCYAGNEEVAKHMSDLSAIGDYSGVSWFNNLLLELILPLGIIQGMHELGHYLIATRDKIETKPPILIPFWILPYMGANTEFKTSPKDSNSLFDFASLGPLAGIIASFIFLFVGMETTVLADAASMQYYPTLPVEALRISSLGGFIVDNCFGVDGYITTQDPSTVIKLHPYAIAGYMGLIINSLDLLPLGSTDGGRMSQSLFGRKGHLTAGSLTWTALLLSTLFVPQNDVLIGAWIVNNIVQNDMEIPARNEVDGVDIFPRGIVALVLWSVAFLTLYPIEI